MFLVMSVFVKGQRSSEPTKFHNITLYNRYNIKKKCENRYNYSTCSS